MSCRSDFDPNPQPGMIQQGWYLSPSLNCKYALFHLILNTFRSLTQSVQPLRESGTIYDHNRPHIELKQYLMPFKAISAYPLKVAAKPGDCLRNRCNTRPKTGMARVYLLQRKATLKQGSRGYICISFAWPSSIRIIFMDKTSSTLERFLKMSSKLQKNQHQNVRFLTHHLRAMNSCPSGLARDYLQLETSYQGRRGQDTCLEI